METPRNFMIRDVELNWARLSSPVNPFGTEQYELQIATSDPAKAQELRENHFNVKEKEGVFTVSLKRKAKKANGDDNGKVRVVDASKSEFSENIGNGSRGNVIVFQYPYEAMGRKGIASSLTAVQVIEHVAYTPTGGVDFDVVGEESATEESAAPKVEF